MGDILGCDATFKGRVAYFIPSGIVGETDGIVGVSSYAVVYLPAMFPCDVQTDLPALQVFQQSGMFQRFIFYQGDPVVLFRIPMKGKGLLFFSHGYE